MAEILDNEVITAEILNEISTDLGYSELKFIENEKFGNDRLNLITGDLVSKGILNLLNRCECTLAEDGRIKVDTGVIVFGTGDGETDGAKKRITDVQYLDILDGGKNYIYAKNDTATGKIYLTNSLTEPTTGDFVLLAEYEDGTITDRRAFAKAKVDLKTEGNSYKKTIEVSTREKYIFSIPVAGVSKLFFEYCINSKYASLLLVFDVKTTKFYGFESYDSYRYGSSFFTIASGGNTDRNLEFINITDDIATFEIDADKNDIEPFNIYAFGGL